MLPWPDNCHLNHDPGFYADPCRCKGIITAISRLCQAMDHLVLLRPDMQSDPVFPRCSRCAVLPDLHADILHDLRQRYPFPAQPQTRLGLVVFRVDPDQVIRLDQIGPVGAVRILELDAAFHARPLRPDAWRQASHHSLTIRLRDPRRAGETSPAREFSRCDRKLAMPAEFTIRR